MIESMIFTMREGLKAVLILGVMLVFLNKTGGERLRKYAILGMIIGIIGAAAMNMSGGMSMEDSGHSGMDDSMMMYETSMMAFGVGLMILFIAMMYRTSGKIKLTSDNKVDLSSTSTPSQNIAMTLLTIAFTSVGVYVIVNSIAQSLTEAAASDGMSSVVAGAGLGIVTLLGIGIFFLYASKKLTIKKNFLVSAGILVIIMFQQVILAMHPYFESPAYMAIAGPMMRGMGYLVVFIALLLVPIVALVVDKLYNDLPKPKDIKTTENRMKMSLAINRGRAKFATGTLAFIVLLLLSSVTAFSLETAPVDKVMPVTATGGEIRISAANVSDKDIHHFVYKDGSNSTRFFLFMYDDTVYSTFNECLICGPAGYYMERGSIICRNCNAPINTETLEMGGGCNPIPLKHQLNQDTGEVVIMIGDLNSRMM